MYLNDVVGGSFGVKKKRERRRGHENGAPDVAVSFVFCLGSLLLAETAAARTAAHQAETIDDDDELIVCNKSIRQ